MEIKTFKKIINDLLIAKNFSKKGNYYRYTVKDVIIVIGLQKSNYANGYYINVGYIITQLNPLLENPRDVDGDVRARFSFKKKGESIDYFDLEELLESDEDKLKSQIEENINQYVKPITSLDTLKALLDREPVMLYQTKLSAKKMLGFE